MKSGNTLKIKLLSQSATPPTRATEGSAGYDLYADIPSPIELLPHKPTFINTGIAIELPTDTVGLIYPRSGLSCKNGITLANSVGVIDSDYRGEILVCLVNQFETPYTLEPNQRFAQLVVTPILTPTIEIVNELSDTKRGDGGYGSTSK